MLQPIDLLCTENKNLFLFSILAANSSTPLKITSTDQGIRLYTFVNFYNDLLQVTWHYKSVLRALLYI